MTAPVVWLGGGLVAADEARLDPTDRGLTLGDGLYETLRARGATQPTPRHSA